MSTFCVQVLQETNNSKIVSCSGRGDCVANAPQVLMRTLQVRNWLQSAGVSSSKEHCGYDTDYRVSLPKKKISVIRLPEFEKEGFKPKDRVFKQEDAF